MSHEARQMIRGSLEDIRDPPMFMQSPQRAPANLGGRRDFPRPQQTLVKAQVLLEMQQGSLQYMEKTSKGPRVLWRAAGPLTSISKARQRQGPAVLWSVPGPSLAFLASRQVSSALQCTLRPSAGFVNAFSKPCCAAGGKRQRRVGVRLQSEYFIELPSEVHGEKRAMKS